MWLGPSVLTPVCHSSFTGKSGSVLFLCNCHSEDRACTRPDVQDRLGNVGLVVYLSALFGRATVISVTWDSVTNRESSSNEWAPDVSVSLSRER